VGKVSNTGIWANQGSSALTLIAQTGSGTPDAPSAIFLSLGDPIYNDNNAVTFFATTDAGLGVWSTGSGTLHLVAQPGDGIPNSPTSATYASLLGAALDEQSSNFFNSQTFFFAKLKDTPDTATNSSNDMGIWSGSSFDSLGQVARLGAKIGPMQKVLTKMTFLETAAYVGGQTRNISTNGYAIFGATFSDMSAALVEAGIGPLTIVAQTSEGATGVTGATYSTFGNPAINASSYVAYAATITGTGIAGANNTGIWADDSTGTRQLVEQSGAIAPGTNSNAKFLTFSDPVYNANEAVSFRGTLSVGTGLATAATASGIWCNSTGTLTLVAQQGRQAPGCPGGVTYNAFTELALDDVNGSTQKGGVIFLATLAGTGVTAANNVGIFAQDNTGTVRLIVRTGDVLDVPGIANTQLPKTITTLRFLPTEALVNGQTRSFSPSTGDLVYKVTFSDKSQAIFNVVFP
jgi:hypothetical protein